MNKVILGFRPWPGVSCPYCGDGHGAIEDDGITSKYLYRCWCGATARVPKDDPDILAAIEVAGHNVVNIVEGGGPKDG